MDAISPEAKKPPEGSKAMRAEVDVVADDCEQAKSKLKTTLEGDLSGAGAKLEIDSCTEGVEVNAAFLEGSTKKKYSVEIKISPKDPTASATEVLAQADKAVSKKLKKAGADFEVKKLAFEDAKGKKLKTLDVPKLAKVAKKAKDAVKAQGGSEAEAVKAAAAATEAEASEENKETGGK